MTFYEKHWEEVDLIILDMNMPVMSGFDCLIKLREINADVKVVISTGYSFQNKTQKVFAAGIAGFVQKPFKLAELSEEIKRVLDL